MIEQYYYIPHFINLSNAAIIIPIYDITYNNLIDITKFKGRFSI
jgi:hypothetical protein